MNLTANSWGIITAYPVGLMQAYVGYSMWRHICVFRFGTNLYFLFLMHKCEILGEKIYKYNKYKYYSECDYCAAKVHLSLFWFTRSTVYNTSLALPDFGCSCQNYYILLYYYYILYIYAYIFSLQSSVV